MTGPIIHHGGSGSKGAGFSSGSGTVYNDSHIMRTVNPFNMNQTVTSSNQFRAMKLVGLMDSTVVTMGTFVDDSIVSTEFQLGIYNEAGVLLGNTALISPGANLHQEYQGDLISPVSITKNNQYWIGLWLKTSLTIPYQIGFANLSAAFPSGIHTVLENSIVSFPNDISSFSSTTQKFSIWAVCKS